MNWHDGLILIWQLYGYGFKSWRTHIKLYFWYFWLWLEYEKLREILVEWQNRGGCKTTHNGIMNGN